jgi:Fe-S cluster assembly protein SufD
MANTLTDAKSWYAAKFAEFERSLNGESKSAVHALRRDALARFAEKGFPTTADEEWRFTNIAPLARTHFTPATRPSQVSRAEIDQLSIPGSLRIVVVNGHHVPELSDARALPKGVRIQNLAAVVKDHAPMVAGSLGQLARPAENAITALGTAFLRDGAYIVLEDGAALESPVQIMYFGTGEGDPTLNTARNLIVVGNGARASIVETYAGRGTGVYWTNSITEMSVGRDAVVEHDKLQLEPAAVYHTGMTHIRLDAGSVVTSNAVSLGGSLVRNNVTAVFAGEHAECTLNGLSVAAGSQLIDNHTVIDHAVPHCASHELYKAILDGNSRGVFNGKIFVRQDAQKTDAKQTNKTLLLSDDATIDTKPQLEIFADDVKCTHGATVGQLDEDQVFYLRARGIGENEARDILTFAFASDVINRLHVDALRTQLDVMLRARLRQGRVTREA